MLNECNILSNSAQGIVDLLSTPAADKPCRRLCIHSAFTAYGGDGALSSAEEKAPRPDRLSSVHVWSMSQRVGTLPRA